MGGRGIEEYTGSVMLCSVTGGGGLAVCCRDCGICVAEQWGFSEGDGSGRSKCSDDATGPNGEEIEEGDEIVFDIVAVNKQGNTDS